MTPDIPKKILKELKDIALRDKWDTFEIYKTTLGNAIKFNNQYIFRMVLNRPGKHGMPVLYSYDTNNIVFRLKQEDMISAAILVGHPNEVFDGFSVDKQVVNP